MGVCPPLPPGTRLLHVGPHKTGTSALQHALDHNRAKLEAFGTIRLGRRRHEAAAVGGRAGRPLPYVSPTEARAMWEALVAQSAHIGDKRAVLSSEYFSDAAGDAVPGIVEEIGQPVHVVATLRPLDKILPSQWQQYVRRGLELPYERWLEVVLKPKAVESGSRRTRSFWIRHRHDRLVSRWAEVVGTDNVTVLVLDPDDHSLLPRTFEALLGLPEMTLDVDGAEVRANRSLTATEAEIVRRYNLGLVERGFDRTRHAQVVRGGLSATLKTRVPGPDEPPIVTPPWARTRAAEIGAQMASTIESTGVRVIGDLEHLSHPSPTSPALEQVGDVTVTPQLAAEFALAVDAGWTSVVRVESSLRQRSTRALLGELKRRMRRRLSG